MKKSRMIVRKNLSLFLTILMVFGLFASIIPTIVVATEAAPLILFPGDLNPTSVGSGKANLDSAFVDGDKTYLKIDPVNSGNNGVSIAF